MIHLEGTYNIGLFNGDDTSKAASGEGAAKTPAVLSEGEKLADVTKGMQVSVGAVYAF